MMLLLLIALALPNPQRVQTVVDERVAVGPGRIRHLEVMLPDTHATLECRFKVTKGDGAVRVVVVDRDAWPELRVKRNAAALASTGYAREGALTFNPRFDGPYIVAIDNRGENTVAVVAELSVRVVWPKAKTADPIRAQTVVWTGVGSFLLLFGWSSYRIVRAVEQRSQYEDRYYYF